MAEKDDYVFTRDYAEGLRSEVFPFYPSKAYLDKLGRVHGQMICLANWHQT